jgi:hypothetical protein
VKKLYSAVLSGKSRIEVFDVLKGIKTYSINLGNVEIVNGPIVTQDKMTIVVKDNSGILKGKVYNLSTGILTYSFAVR